MKKENKDIILLSGMIISSLLSWASYWYITRPHEIMNTQQWTLNDYINAIYQSQQFHYDYGIWLIFSGLFITFLCEYCNIPDPYEIIVKCLYDIHGFFGNMGN